MELTIPQFNKTIEKFFQRNPIKNKDVEKEIKDDNKKTKKEIKNSYLMEQ